MDAMISFEDSVNDSLNNDSESMDTCIMNYFLFETKPENSFDIDMSIFKKNIDSTDDNSDNNNIISIPDNQFKKEKDINKKENEEKHMNDIKEESELKYNKDGTLQKKRGRKKLNEEVNEEDIIHKKTDKDNIIYKLKTHGVNSVFDFLNKLLIKNGIPFKFQKIKGKIVKDGKRNSNLVFLKKKISEILKMERSGRYRRKNIQSNENIIKLIELKKINEIIKILEMRFIDFFQDIYMKKSSEELETEYGVKCDFLFLETTFDKDKTKNEEQKKIMSELNEYGLIQYFEKIIPRNPKKKKILMSSG